MKALIDIPDEIAEDVEQIRKQQGISRVELIRRAIGEYVKSHTPPSTDAFGIFKESCKPVVDGLDYQRSLREEW